MDILVAFVTLIVLFQIKHYLFDFPFQTQEMIAEKGTFLAPWGIVHSLNHGGWSAFIAMCFIGWPGLLVGLLDFVIHYSVDYVKVRFGTKTQNKAFWNEFGLDQAIHQMTYVLLAVIVVNALS